MDSFSRVPYEKGYHFLKYLESILGYDNFINLIATWIDKNAFKSVTTEDFRSFLFKTVFK